MKRQLIVVTVVLVTVVLISVFAASQLLNGEPETSKFYVGVEVAYANATASDVQAMVDKVKDYTNLVVIGSPEISLNQTALNETCDYINDAGLYFIVLFTRSPMYTTYNPFLWMSEAQEKYDKFLGVYRYDEPGGHQIDQGSEALVIDASSYADAAEKYIKSLGPIVKYYLNYSGQVFTADYALQWFDYESNYSAVFSEFTSNNTREIAVAQCRGAAASNFGRNWGVMLTWKYDVPPYIEPAGELYTDMVSAYKAGAKYVIVFDYPKLDMYGILTEKHFDALKQFWDYAHDNPQDFGSQKAKVAYVLPEDYGFGMRRPNDSIWGLFPPDKLSAKVWNDMNESADVYGFGLDIIYNEPGVVDAAKSRYERLFFWNETVS